MLIARSLCSTRRGSLFLHPSGSTLRRRWIRKGPPCPWLLTLNKVHHKIVLVYGTIGEPGGPAIDGTLHVGEHNDNLSTITWPVCDSHFKALVYLHPGLNIVRFEFTSPKLANGPSPNSIHTSSLMVHMIPSTSAQPLQLAILLAKDSPATFDALPAKVEKEGNGLEMAIRKFRMAAYLWQAFTAEQMWRNNMGRRVFRYDEEWAVGSMSHRDRENGTMRSEARVHIIRSDKTISEMRDLNRAQQNEEATEKDALWGFAADAVRRYFMPLPGQKIYASVLLLDAHWDKDAKVITGHAALGGGSNNLQLAVFGSHCLHSYPSSLDDVVSALTDCTPTDSNYLANDCGDAGSSWEAANIGIGAHLHETGHLLGCPHQETGIMLRDYVVLNRTFIVREAYSTRTRSKGGLCLQGDECRWHRLDCLRFRSHPLFRLPHDNPPCQDENVQAFALENGNMWAMAASGISFVEIFGEGDDVCHAWIEYTPEKGTTQRQVPILEQELRAKLPDDKCKGRIKICIHSHAGGSLVIDDWDAFTSKDSLIKLSNGKVACRGHPLGHSKLEGSQSQDVVFTSAAKHNRVMSRMYVYHGSALDGLEFVYDDDSTQLFGKKGGKEGGDVVDFGTSCQRGSHGEAKRWALTRGADIRRGEYLTGFLVRAGLWIDGIQIITSLGRKTAFFGNAQGGSA